MSPLFPALYVPRFVTETDQASPWYDCTWASAVMLDEVATLGAVPATRDERQALRALVKGPIGGSNLDDVTRATQIRYGWPTPRFGGTWGALLAAIGSHSGAELCGIYAKLPEHFTRWDPGFAAMGSASTHAVFVCDYRPDGTLLWFDPLAQNTLSDPTSCSAPTVLRSSVASRSG